MRVSSSSTLRLVLQLLAVQAACSAAACVNARQRGSKCRAQPGDPSFPTNEDWSQLNATVGGRLVPVIPSAKFCSELPAGSCTLEQWMSTTFRGTIPGAMNSYNFEQDYLSNPPSLCISNGTDCGQGNVPVFAINASSVADIQAGVKFASKHNLKVAVKASGHDFLGRSTAKGSLLLWTHYFRNVSFTESFRVGDKDFGSAVTVGSGIPVNELYTLVEGQGKFVVTGVAATVVAAGGYIQGGGHSAFSPLLGLAADNVYEFKLVTPDGDFITANDVSHSNLFWALRGGGAGSWGVIISATFRTYPAFNATMHSTQILAPTNETAGALAQLHAQHIFDWDTYKAGQYFFMISFASSGGSESIFVVLTFFANMSAEEATSAMQPFMDDVRLANFTIIVDNTTTALASQLTFQPDNQMGINSIIGSRLIPERVYREDVAKIGETYTALLNDGSQNVLGHLVAGGQVAENVGIDSAITPKWRTAKTHIVVSIVWDDQTPVPDVLALQEVMTNRWVPMLADLTGEPDSGSYSNEADVREPNFQTTFFGPNYDKLLSIKRKYDPDDLFIVGAGVGSEDWDVYGVCRV